MENNNPIQWTEVKKLKFHHRVKRFYYKNLFRKIYTVAIVGLIAANIFSMVKYSSFAEDVYTIGSEYNNVWGGGNDYDNNYGLDLDNREERQGPCPSGYHVPSIGEWNAIAIARCHQEDNNCNEEYTYGNILNSLNYNGVDSEFKSDFGMLATGYWSSSRKSIGGDGEEDLAYFLNLGEENYIEVLDRQRSNAYGIRCTKPIESVDNDELLGFTSNANDDGDYELIYGGKKFTIASGDLVGTYYWGASENTDNSHLKCGFSFDHNKELINHESSKTFRPSEDNEDEEVTAICDNGTMKYEGRKFTYGYGVCTKGDEWNTATLDRDDGDYVLTYGGNTYTIASGDLEGKYFRGINITSTNGEEYNNVWGGSGDIGTNGYSPNPTNFTERQGPCPSGWHVPSRGEWAAIVIARCHQTNNSCNPSTDLNNKDGNGNLYGIGKNGMGTAFKNSFGMAGSEYWLSSPSNNNGSTYALTLMLDNYNISLSSTRSRGESKSVRCINNSIEEVANTSALGLNNDNEYGNYELTYNGKKYVIASGDLQGTYLRGINTPLTSSDGSEYNNVWGGEGDGESNNYSPNPTNLTDRRGPCPSGYHVPSIGEWTSIMEARCHLSGSNCTSCSLKYQSEEGEEYSGDDYIKKLSKSGIGSNFKSGFNMSDNYYWSSSPRANNSSSSWFLYLDDSDSEPQVISPAYNSYSRGNDLKIRCVKNPVIPTFTINFAVSPEGYGSVDMTSITVAEGTSITVEGDTVTVGDDSVQATPTDDTEQYEYEFVNWTNNCGTTLSHDCTITANFSRLGKYTINFAVSPEGYGSVDRTSITVDEGTSITVEGDTVTVGDESAKATPTSGTVQYDYKFVNWTNNCENTVSHDCTITAYFSRDLQKYIITWKDGESTLKTEEYGYGATPSYVPTKVGHRFKGWIPDVVEVARNAVYTAVWEAIQNTSPSYGGGGGGGGGGRTGVTKTDDKVENNAENNVEEQTHGVADDTESVPSDADVETSVTDVDNSSTSTDEDTSITTTTSETYSPTSAGSQASSEAKYTPEFKDAYSFAKANGITTQSTIQDAKMYTELTRIQMAKMLSQYAVNVLGQTPDVSKGTVKFNDVPSKLDAEYDNGVTLSYQLGIMGQNMKNNNFRPKDKVTRAEFATALSRMLFDTEDGTGKLKYYEPHMAKLYNEGIITNTNPKLVEKRGYVMTMLMRTVKSL